MLRYVGKGEAGSNQVIVLGSSGRDGSCAEVIRRVECQLSFRLREGAPESWRRAELCSSPLRPNRKAASCLQSREAVAPTPYVVLQQIKTRGLRRSSNVGPRAPKDGKEIDIFSTYYRRLLRHRTISRSTAAMRGTATGASSGEYTAKLCSGGKYSNASIPGLKKAREARVKAFAEYCKASNGESWKISYIF